MSTSSDYVSEIGSYGKQRVSRLRILAEGPGSFHPRIRNFLWERGTPDSIPRFCMMVFSHEAYLNVYVIIVFSIFIIYPRMHEMDNFVIMYLKIVIVPYDS